VGKSVQINFIRKGQPQTATVEIAERPADIASVQPVGPGSDQTEQGRLGVQVQTVTPDLAERNRFRISSGALVVAVQEGSPAANADIRRGDIIHSFDRTEIKNGDDLSEAVKSVKDGDQIAVQIERSGRLFRVTVVLD